MPTNLGSLASSSPVIGPRVQIKRGGAEAGYDVGAGNNGQWVLDGAGGYMSISVTTRSACYWIVKSNLMTHGMASGNNWRRWDHAIWLTTTDADGVDLGYSCPHQIFDAATVEWRSAAGSACFRLNGGQTYAAVMVCQYCNPNYGITYYSGRQWARLVGVIVGEAG